MAPDDDAAAVEASLIENLARLDPDEMTQFETFVRLVKAGKTVPEIAATFGIAEVVVKRRLALGNLLPKIRAAYRREEIDAETVCHLTMASKVQQKDWLALFEDPKQYAPRAWQLKQWLFGGQEIATAVAIFPLEAYKGQIVADLFGESAYFADPDLFWTLQNEAIAAKRDALLAAGWTAVDILEPGQILQSWEFVKTPKEEGGKVVITVRHTGEVSLHEGYLSHKEAARRLRKAAGGNEREAGEKPKQTEITKAMQNYLELHRHAAVRQALLSHPGLALRLMVSHAIGGSGLWEVKPERQRADKRDIAESLAASKAQAAFAQERKAVQELLDLPVSGTVTGRYGDDCGTAAICSRLLALSDEEVRRVLAFVMGETLEAGTALVEALGVHLGVDMAKYWQPDETFFGLLRNKAVINAMLKQVGGKRIADGNVTATAKVQKGIIRDFLNGENDRKKVEGWLPNYMAFPVKAYTKNGGIAIQEAWSRVKDLLKAA